MKYIGMLMVASPFIGIGFIGVMMCGWESVLIAFGITVLIISLIVGGIGLISNGS